MTLAVTPEPVRGRLARIADRVRPWLPRAIAADDPVDATLATWLKPQRYVFAGAALILVVFGALTVWNATSDLERGAVAQGVVQPESYRKSIGSPYGAVVQQILVRENQHVEAGDTLLLLDPTGAEVNTRVLERKHWAAQAHIARLTAIRSGSDQIDFPKDLLDFAANDPEIAGTVAAARASFASSRASLAQRLEQFRSQQRQTDEALTGKRGQRAELVVQRGLILKELEGVQFLLKQGLERKPKLLELQRTQASLDGDIAAADATIARLENQRSEMELRAQSMIADEREAASRELNTAWNADLESVDRLKAARDTQSFTVIRAPQSGTVLNLKVHTVGAAIRANDALLELVPDRDALMLRVVVRPQDVNDVTVGTPAHVSIHGVEAGLRRLDGRVLSVSPDLIPNPRSPMGTYIADVEILPGALTPQARKRLQPGMDATVKLITGHRSVWTYMTEGLTDALGSHRRLLEENEHAAEKAP